MKIRTLLPIACLLTGCASMPFGAGKDTKPGHSQPEVSAPAPAPSGLKEGIALYNNGDYNGAIKRLGQADVTGGPKATQVEALKYTAFSYCLTSRTTLCRHQFEKAFKLDPSFDLEPGEHGHPLWGPVFVKAKKAK
ncbi:TssQ family T6SS-associated lipoprotein [Massilia sp. R2A-15]|uniref:TssQ family T6SS-associated lipoprotein n=1 Tax=Massilia sp. R2A-15 TaxID=3064278 RepID=UPI002734E37E|nr:TssQ family T6SS-associated lipoprotein [Massilia sp. R2A-15]WLI91697.1 TssQ family T6SS-associated lipoprotein [Massilia sp. R2A-15]